MGTARLAAAIVVGAAAALGACGVAPKPAPEGAAEGPKLGQRRADAVDDCAQVPGKPAPQPLKKEYTGVAAKARCQREVYTIMGGLTHFLGVKCAYCHEEPDYAKMTHKKHVANWMARELIPSLQKKNGGGELWCNDCHGESGSGKAKVLGAPRDQKWTVEWMTTHLVEDFEAKGGNPLRCKDCHGANLGSPDFRREIILTDHLPGPKRESAPPPEPAAAPPPQADADAGAADAG